MARDFYIAGECLIYVKSRADSSIGSLSQLGLTADPVRYTVNAYHRDIQVDAWGGQAPAEVQWMLADVTIELNLIHFDMAVLNTCWALSQGGGQPAVGAMQGVFNRAGSRLGNNVPRFAVGNNYIGLNIAAPVGNVPFRFYYTYMTGPPISFPVGTEKSIVRTLWRAVPYTQDPAGVVNGVITGATNYVLWDNTLDS